MINTYYIGGTPCSEKTTIAEILSERYDLYYFKVDDVLDKYTKMGVSSGNAIPYVKELLEVKGIELSAGFEYHMVDNYIIAHGSPEERKMQELVSSAYKKY